MDIPKALAALQHPGYAVELELSRDHTWLVRVWGPTRTELAGFTEHAGDTIEAAIDEATTYYRDKWGENRG